MGLTEVLAFAAFACGAIYCWLKYNYGYWKRKGIPYCDPVPFLGNTQDMFMLRNNFGRYLSKMYGEKRFQDEKVVGIYTLNKPALIIRDLEYLKSILIRDFKKFPNRYASSDPHGDALGSNNLFFVNNPKWKEIRTKLTPVFTSGKIKQMYPLMQEIGNDLETHLAGYDKKGHTITAEVKEICALYTTDMIATIAFGLKINSLGDPNTKFFVEGKKMFDFSLGRSFDFFVAFFLPRLATLLRVKIFSKSYTKLLRENIGYVMSERERNGNIRNDLIDILVTLKKEATLELDRHHFAKNNDFLVAQAAVFIAAGFETSSSTMSFALYELAKHPELQQRLRNEIHAALVEGNGEVSYEKTQSMEFLGLVLDEVLRLYPVLPFLDRQCTIEDGAEALSLKPDYDFEIPDGMAVFVPVFGIQRDAKYWPNPNKFDPERFSAENRKYHTPMTYIPFGTGPRHCMGSRIGLLQSKIGLIRILKNHHVATCDRTVREIQFDPKALTLQCDGGIYLDIVYDGLYDKHRKT